MTGTAPGISSVAVSGGPAEYLIKVGPLTAAGTVQVKIAAGALNDAWKQPTRASNTASARFADRRSARIHRGRAPPVGQTRQRYAHQFAGGREAGGRLPP